MRFQRSIASIRVVTSVLLLSSLAAVAAEALEPPAPAPRTIVLVRHGAYDPDPKAGPAGPGLSPIGVAQARLAGARLAGMPEQFDALYASPLTRADETARVIGADFPELKLETLPGLRECTPSTRRKEVIAKEKPESMAACAAQLDALFAERFVPATGTAREELFVCHGNVTRYLITRALGVDPEAWLEMSVGHASITRILVEPDGRFKVISIGDLGHIPPNMQTGSTGMTEKALKVP